MIRSTTHADRFGSTCTSFRLRRIDTPHGSICLTIAFALALAGTSTARAQSGACCTGEECVDVANESACNAEGGIFLIGAECINDACGNGACCLETSCLETDAFSCIAAGRDFAGGGTECADDPCEIGVGACCIDGTCAILLEDACTGVGGAWQGPGTTCLLDPCEMGACCTPGACAETSDDDCAALDGVFFSDQSCGPDACVVENGCDGDSLFGQSPNGSDDFILAGTSEFSTGLTRYENFEGVIGPIETITWYGLELDLVEELGDFVVCIEPDPTFEIAFYKDFANSPGEMVCSYTATVDGVGTGIMFDDDAIELQEYSLVLPEPCVLTEGWISIVGFGDAECWFLWMASSSGDGLSWCDNCLSEDQENDLAICLDGPVGGALGACCVEAEAACDDGVDISECAAPAQRFAFDTTCAELDPACGDEVGACCMGDGTCAIDFKLSCEDGGGEWLGVGSVCDDCPPVGACCQGEACFILTEEDCESELLNWLGPDSSCDECPSIPECPPDSIYSQNPDGPVKSFSAGTSEDGQFVRYEDYAGVAGAIDALTWWGLDLDHIEGTNSFEECVESDPTFEIIFYTDAAGVPGDPVCSYTLLADAFETGVEYLNAELNEYSVVLDPPCVQPNGWVSIVGQGDPECWFLWMSAGFGSSYCEGCAAPDDGVDLSMCLGGEIGGISGACCDDGSATCLDAVDITECIDPSTRFAPDTTCDNLDPPCGTITGACCQPDLACSATSESECAAAGGDWLGANTSCLICPCIVSCDGVGEIEGEPICFPNYVDEFNGGCNSQVQSFSPIGFCDPVCGTSGIFENGFAVPDEDWYELVLDESTEITFTVEAEMPVGAVILDGNDGCEDPDIIDQAISELTCETVSVTSNLSAGTYWLVVTPIVFTDTSACGATYTATVTRDFKCNADFNGDGFIGKEDHASFVDCFAGPNATPMPTEPTSVSDCLATFDLDHDDDVDEADFAAFAAVFTGVPPGSGDHDCCELGGPGCDNGAIEDCVCATDPFCCDFEWDQTCIQNVESLGCGICK